ncbi:Oidioi.mRNA.OKI2018_I69.chr1.g3023.t1.cds [Oikopleura dioica]|uniref:Kinetochore protein NDC80 n=1 Tax=Oikopleura dioica TaxID=34765 RepID=A0ABN7SUL6_OIKDI|nr:Oidioi.mRNA.OKI2018_I69.chr1.g3023.t1.cds [Oikopleura dioica]
MFSRKSEMDGHRRLTTVRKSEFPSSGGRQPRDSLTADSYRLSIAGGQSTIKRPKTHSSNDPRDLAKKANQKEVVEKLQNFLINEINFREVSLKELSNMTTGLFHEIFSTFVRIILGPNYLMSFGKVKPAELIVETMRAVDYPFKLVKSSFVNLTKQTFPTAIGVLDWLIDLIGIQQAAENAAQDTADIEEIIPIFEGYARYAAGEGDIDDITDDVTNEVAKSKQEQLALEEIDIDDAYRRMEEAELELKDFKNAKRCYENDLVDLTKAIEDSTKFLNLSKYHVEKGAAEIKTLREEETKQKEMIEQLKKDNAELRERIGDQETAIEKKNRYNALVEEDQKWQETVAAQRQDLGIIEVKISRERATAADILINYNTAANSLREFSEKFKIPSSISAKNLSMLEEKQKLIGEADQLCHKQISSLRSETDVLNFENDELEKRIQEEQDDHDLVKTQFESRFQKSKAELNRVEEENAHMKSRIGKRRENVMSISEDIETLQSDRIDLERKLQDVKENDENANYGDEEERTIIDFLESANDKKNTADTQFKIVQSIFEEEMSVIQTRVKRNEEIHEFITRKNFD